MHIYADKSEKKVLINLKKWFIYWLQKISYYLSDFIHIQLLSHTSIVSMSIIRAIDRFSALYFIFSFWANGDNDDDLCISH